MADPLLTTFALDPKYDSSFTGLSINHPRKPGRLVARTKLFHHNALTKNSRPNNSTLLGRCAYCQGIYLLPCQAMVLCYFIPTGLYTINQEIIELWQSQTISVCAVHFLHRAVRPDNGILQNFISSSRA